jgi:hypothetical protein
LKEQLNDRFVFAGGEALEVRQQKLPRRREDPLRMYFAIPGALAVSLQKLLCRANKA